MSTSEHGSQIPDAPGPHPDEFWGSGGCVPLALAFVNKWPDLKIGASFDDDGNVNHAWVHDGRRAHDFMGTHNDPQGPNAQWPSRHIDMDTDPNKLATNVGALWDADHPWDDDTVREAGREIEKHWLGNSHRHPR